MTELTTAHLKLLKEVVSLPTATFHEDLVQEYVLFFAQEHRLEAVTDRYGNIVIEYKNGRGVGEATPVAFLAHMDHPGFVVVEVDPDGRHATAEFRGGTKADFFPGAELLVYGDGRYVKARATGPLGQGDRMRDEFPRFALQCDSAVAVGNIGWFDVPFATVVGNRLHTKSADDLAQVAMQLAMLDALIKSNVDAHVFCIFTRAEEVGFVGAAGLLKTTVMPREGVPVIVLECSKALPAVAQIGQGFVLRVGDRATLYDPEMDLWMARLAGEMQAESHSHAQSATPPAGTAMAMPIPEDFKFQRALLSGGACEAALLAKHRSRVGGLALPLGNYHNIGDGKPEPEIISLADAAHQLAFMTRLATLGYDGRATTQFAQRIDELFHALAHRLEGNTFANSRIDRPSGRLIPRPPIG